MSVELTKTKKFGTGGRWGNIGLQNLILGE